mgnify:CR=1 FL=1
MSVWICSIDLKTFDFENTKVKLDLASVLDFAKIKGIPVHVEFNAVGQIKVFTATDEDARTLYKACLEEIEARSDLVNSFINGF